MKCPRSLYSSTRGATMIELVLVTSLVALVAIGAWAALGDATQAKARCAASAIEGSGGADCAAGGAGGVRDGWAARPPMQGPVGATRAALGDPVQPGDFPDPTVIQTRDDGYLAYSTNWGAFGAFYNVPVLRSDNLRTWSFGGDALPELGAWARPGLTWAPSVQQFGDGYVLYYVARDRASDRQCIGRAVSSEPDGPFTDASSAALVCQTDHGGSIDPQPFVDRDGRPYLLWKTDDNAIGGTTRIWSQELSPDGTALVGEPHELLAQDRAWEEPLIENPAMVYRAGAYWLFYSANWWESAGYAVGYARCEGPAGPCTKVTTEGPWLSSTPNAAGPGGASFFEDEDGRMRVAFHAWDPARTSYASGGSRSLHIETVRFTRDGPTIDEDAPPTSTSGRIRALARALARLFSSWW